MIWQASCFPIPPSMENSPWKVLSSQVSVSILSEGWNLDVIDPHDDGIRRFLVQVYFDNPFYGIPVVNLSLTGFDIDQRDSARLTLSAENINPSGFTATISTWADTRVFGVDFQWLAIGA